MIRDGGWKESGLVIFTPNIQQILNFSQFLFIPKSYITPGEAESEHIYNGQQILTLNSLKNIRP